MSVPRSSSYSLNSTLGDPVTIRDWNLKGLPVDTFSIDNAIIVKNAFRWPLMVDPQGHFTICLAPRHLSGFCLKKICSVGQANKWIKNVEKLNKPVIVKLSDQGYMQKIEKAVQLGVPVILENIGEEVDPAIGT